MPGTLRPSAGRDYSPFNNVLSQITESVLAKRTADDFASVAAAGVVTTTSATPNFVIDKTAPSYKSPPTTDMSDPDLMAKAPGYRPPASIDPSKAPGHRAGKDAVSFGPRSVVAANDVSVGYQPADFPRPNSTPTVAMSLMDNTDLVGHALGSSLDRPPSLYATPGPMYGFSQLPGHLPAFSATSGMSLEQFAVSLPHAGSVGGIHQVFGAPCSLGSSVNETSVLAAPLMTTSVATGSALSPEHQNVVENRLGVSSSTGET